MTRVECGVASAVQPAHRKNALETKCRTGARCNSVRDESRRRGGAGRVLDGSHNKYRRKLSDGPRILPRLLLDLGLTLSRPNLLLRLSVDDHAVPESDRQLPPHRPRYRLDL